jgi:hypothetical protein
VAAADAAEVEDSAAEVAVAEAEGTSGARAAGVALTETRIASVGRPKQVPAIVEVAVAQCPTRPCANPQRPEGRLPRPCVSRARPEPAEGTSAAIRQQEQIAPEGAVAEVASAPVVAVGAAAEVAVVVAEVAAAEAVVEGAAAAARKVDAKELVE